MAYESLSPEELARKFGAKIEGGPQMDDAEAMARKFGATIHGDPLTPLQAGGAFASGFNRAVIAGVGGLPVDTVLNVGDLARAAYGYAGSKAGFLKPEDLPAPLDRSRYVGSSAYIADKMQGNPYTAAAINNPRPDAATARMLHAGGGGVGAGMSMRPGVAGMQFASGVAGQGATELGADPAWSMVASMAPQTAVTGGAMATRGAARGGEAGRLEMERRMREFEAAGVDPTVGLATGNRRTQAVESMLSKVPGGAGVMASKVEGMQGQMQNTANAARDQVSPVYGPVAAGEAIKRGIVDYRQRQQDAYGAMQDRALAAVPQDMTFPTTATMQRGAATLTEIPGAPNVSRAINQPLGLTREVLGALEKDTAPSALSMRPSQILAENGQPFMTQVSGNPGGLSFEGIKALKSRIGQAAYADNPLLADANTGAMKELYAGAKQDLHNAAALADAERVNRGQLPAVSRELSRADRFYTQTQKILEDVLAPIHKAGDPAAEKSFYRIESDARNSGAQVSKAMASLPLEARRQTAATVIDRLGRAAPGQQNAEGSAFSPQTFLTNWNRITPEARTGIFLGVPNASSVRDKLDALARSASMIRDANKVYSNASGTGQATALIGTGMGLASGVTGLATGHAAYGLATLGTILGSGVMARFGAWGMTNPKFVTWLSQTTAMKPEQLNAHLRRLAANAKWENDPEQRATLETIAAELKDELGL